MIVTPPQILNCAVYIYPSKESATVGELSSGGSGVSVFVPLKENQDAGQIYVVTARHVIEKMRNPVLRINKNKTGGGMDCFETNRSRWVDHPDGDDLAALPIDLDPESLDLLPVLIEMFVDETIRGQWLLPGDEVFMIGRFFSHEGTQRNTPSVRFGNISMLPHEPMRNDRGFDQESFLVEQRSLPGYSGSPVFVYIDPANPRPPEWKTPVRTRFRPEFNGPWLLGIDWCHLHNFEPVLKNDQETRAEPKQWVKSHTGMAGVIPAWRVLGLLETEVLVKQREKEDADITAQKKVSHISLDSAEPSEKEFTQTDFEAALRKVSRKIVPEK
jgi:hypothetical protein